MDSYLKMHLDPQVLARYQLPNLAYPLRTGDLSDAMPAGGDLPFALMLYRLQEHCGAGTAEWLAYEPAMDRLAELLAPPDDRSEVSACGDDWWLEIGPVELHDRLVTIQRADMLVAAMTARADGRLRVAVLRPLDAKSARYLTGLGQLPHPVHGVSMRANNWEYALDCSAGAGNIYADARGEAYLSYWEHGLGVGSDGSPVQEWQSSRGLTARPAARVAIELGVHYSLSDDAA